MKLHKELITFNTREKYSTYAWPNVYIFSKYCAIFGTFIPIPMLPATINFSAIFTFDYVSRPYITEITSP